MHLTNVEDYPNDSTIFPSIKLTTSLTRDSHNTHLCSADTGNLLQGHCPVFQSGRRSTNAHMYTSTRHIITNCQLFSVLSKDAQPAFARIQILHASLANSSLLFHTDISK